MKRMEDGSVVKMEDTEILRNAIKERGVLQSDLADKLGVLQSTISMHLNRKRIGLDVFRSILDAIDYDVVIVDRNTGEAVWKVDQKK